MTLRVRKVGDLAELNAFLRGGVIGGAGLKKGAYNLDGKTLILTTPVATVTFDTNPEGTQQPLTLPQIISQINATAGLTGYATAVDGRLKLEDPNGASGVALGNGTANTILGFKNLQEGTVYASPGESAPSLVSVDVLQNVGGGYLVVTDEA